ncbi:hypothetical protein EW145_g2315 [Phellinidium pouzarii]|uniref:carnosine N-methyltransferase n=1 Tax=Phellinidium pouzarii TaxID=167371 RepID=A0A4S4LBD4_9AGAM|nr:hypothetical protein EW145_g2315 [Phellinidium pouzarii]
MPQPSKADILEEQKHFANVVTTFQQYGAYALAANNRRRKDLHSLSQADQQLLDELGWKEKLVDIDQAIIANAKFVEQMIADPEIFSDADLAEEDYEQEDGDVDGGGGLGASQSKLFANRLLFVFTLAPGHSHPLSEPPHSHSRSHNHAHGHSHPSHSAGPSSHGLSHDHSGSKKDGYRPTDFDMDKLRSTLKQFVRDWSEEVLISYFVKKIRPRILTELQKSQGKIERDACYEPMKEALLKHFVTVPKEERSKLRVLVPGAGLGRLAYDVARLGFSCQGNEFSHYMLLASFFILNRTQRLHQHTIYPHVHSLSNTTNRAGILRPITLPDALPSAIPQGVNFSLVAGDFEEVYGTEDHDDDEPQAGEWDAILTCFFIDTVSSFSCAVYGTGL